MANTYGQSERPTEAYIVVHTSKRGDGTPYEHVFGPFTKRGASSKLAYEARYGVKSDYHIEKTAVNWERA